MTDINTSLPRPPSVTEPDRFRQWATRVWLILRRGATTSEYGAVKQAAAVADLDQTISGPSAAEVQEISDKVDELLASLRASGQVSS